MTDSRTPDIIVAPNVGVVYTGSAKKQSEHGGFANDDTNVMMLVSNPSIEQSTKADTKAATNGKKKPVRRASVTEIRRQKAG